MYKLLMTHRSPFARRVWIALKRLGLDHELALTEPFHAGDELVRSNPLGLIPVLCAQGASIPDSNTILEYLHEWHGNGGSGIWPEPLAERTECRVLSTYATGVMGNTVALFLERQRQAPSPPSTDWIEDHQETILRTLRLLESKASRLEQLPQARLDTGTALDYLDFRAKDIDWRSATPGLQRILDQCLRVPEFSSTRPRLEAAPA